ncbi:MAG: nicotinamide riboside transporter PnuC [Pseudomonadales bacterium]
MDAEPTRTLLDALLSAWTLTSPAEVVAVVFGIAYLLLAVRQHIACWYAALISTGVSIYLFWNVALLMESALNVFYVVMACYGWYQWQYGRGTEAAAGPGEPGAIAQRPLPVSRWTVRQHALALIAVVSAAAVSGTLLQHNTGAAFPYLDSFTTWGSVLATYMVARKILENWLYWIVIDGLSIILYWDRALYLYAILFACYLVIAVFGYLRWRQELPSGLPAG